MTSDLVSIIMPLKNEEAYIEECIHSIIAQSYTHWELLAVDDHSTDESWNYLKQFAENDLRIIPIKNNGNGIIDALKTGFEKSSGHYITRMDADDMMPKHKIRILKSLLVDADTLSISTGCVKYFSDDQIQNGFAKYEQWLNNFTIKNDHFTDIYKECVIPSPCWMMNRNAFNQCGGFNNSIYPEDYDLVFRIYSQDVKIISSTEVLHFWRDYPTRTSRTDSNYQDNSFIDLKVYHFSKIDFNQKNQLFLWGAGKKGKRIAQRLAKLEIPFRWICNNAHKIGKKIYGTVLENADSHQFSINSQIIIAVANPDEQIEIRNNLELTKLEKGKNYYFFC